MTDEQTVDGVEVAPEMETAPEMEVAPETHEEEETEGAAPEAAPAVEAE